MGLILNAFNFYGFSLVLDVDAIFLGREFDLKCEGGGGLCRQE
jgi:hypothetical protein